MRPFRGEHVPKPEIAPELLAKFGPMDLEIGAGRGLFAVRYCQAHPERTLLAIERTQMKFAGLEQRRTHHPDLKNLIALHADATSVVTHYIQPTSLTRVFMLYPNPYPKAKHANRRFHNQPFMHELKAKMAPGAELILATNLEWYAREAEMRMPLNLAWRRTLTQESPPRTHFEKKYLARGETCFELGFTKSE